MIGKPLRRPPAGAETRLARVRIQGLLLFVRLFLPGYETKNASATLGLGRRCCASVKQGSSDERLSAEDDRRKRGSWCSGRVRTQETKNWLVKSHDKKTPRSSFRRSARGLTTIRPPMSRVGRCEDDTVSCWRDAQGGARMRAYKRPVPCTMAGCSRRRLDCVRTSKPSPCAVDWDAQDERSTKCNQQQDTKSHTLTGEGECWKLTFRM